MFKTLITTVKYTKALYTYLYYISNLGMTVDTVIHLMFGLIYVKWCQTNSRKKDFWEERLRGRALSKNAHLSRYLPEENFILEASTMSMEDVRASFSRMKVKDPVKILQVVFTEEDEEFCGFQGLDKDFDVLYRVCRDDEDTDSDIKSKLKPITVEVSENVQIEEKKAKDAINQHIHSGHIPTQFISCTASKQVALEWAYYDNKEERPEKLQIIKIYIAKIPTETKKFMINLNDEKVRDHFLRGKPQKDFAKGGQEVLFQWKIPKKTSTNEDVFELLKNTEKPPQPKKKNKKKGRV